MSNYAIPVPVVTARGFLFASLITSESASAYHPTLCAYQGLRLKPIDALDFTASPAEAFVPSSETEPALLAMNVTFGRTPSEYRFELQVFAMNGDGDLQPLYTEEFPFRILWLLFHPSRRFLYVADAASQLRTYAVDATGRVELLTSIDSAGGSMAITR